MALLPLFLVALTAVSVTATPVPNASPFSLAPLYTPPAPPASSVRADFTDASAHLVQDSYIIVLDDHLAEHHVHAHHAHVAKLHHADKIRARSASFNAAPVTDFTGVAHKYAIGQAREGKAALRGYSGHFSAETIEQVRSLRGVKYVERDSLVWTQEVEKGAPWGLARVSHRKHLSFGTFNRYEYDGHGGEGVDAYVIDTGINIDHVEFEGRARWGKTIPNDVDRDMNGHGSHCAGTIASNKYGVAKKANLIAVKVLGAGGSGSMSDVVAGVAWAADSAYEAMKAKKNGKNPKHKGSVANMSLGGGKSQALDDAVDAAVLDGLHFAVAAGNDAKDACAYSPAASKLAITVGASTLGDELAYFSNVGPCVDINGPGLNILSVWNSGNTSTNVISGTSMASPHVAGEVAYFLSLYPESFNVETGDFLTERAAPASYLRQSAQIVFGKVQEWAGVAPVASQEISPKALKAALLKVATKGALTGLKSDTPNLLLFNNYTTSG